MHPPAQTTGFGGASSQPDAGAPAVEVDAFPQYFIGFPMLVAITCDNVSSTGTFFYLAECEILTALGPVEFVFTGQDAKRIVLPVANTTHWDPPVPIGFTLRPGESRRMLFDISGVDAQLEPGTYRLEATYHGRIGASTAPPVQVKLIGPSRSDLKAAAELREQNDLKEASWAYFLQHNWQTVDASSLSGETRDVLAFHLFLHRAIYGPIKVGDLNVKDLQTFAEGPLKAEAAVLGFEILSMRRDRAADREGLKILKKWPGLKWRLQDIQSGEGMLSSWRKEFGAEREFETPPDSYPYTTKP